MKYTLYPFLMDEATKAVYKDFWASRGLKSNKHTRSHKEALNWLFNMAPDLIKRMDTVIMADEYYWMTSDREVIFPASEKVLEKLLTAKVDLANTAPVKMPYDTFIVAMPKGFTWNGMVLPSAQVTWVDGAQRDRLIEDFSTVYVGSRITRGKNPGEQPDEKILIMNYRMRDEELVAIDGEMAGALATYRVAVSEKMIPDLMRCKNGDEYQELLGDFSIYYNVLDLNPYDREMQFALARLVVMMAIYVGSYPKALKEGYPGDLPKQPMEPKLHKSTWKKRTLNMPTDDMLPEGEKNYHYRSWHFRQLTAERYYRGEHKDKPIGSRVVFVKDAMVGRHIEAMTLE